jgi:hypothetical protein
MMTSRERVQATGRLLAAVALGRGLLCGATVAVMLLAITHPWASNIPAGWRFGSALLAGAAAMWLVYRKVRGPGFDIPFVSLWIEERVPALRYALVTAIEPGAPTAIERSVATVDWNPATREAARRSLQWPLVALIGASLALVLSIGFTPAMTRLAERVSGTRGTVSGALDVTVEVQPPPYSRLASESHRNPPVIRALVGSRLRVSAAGRSGLQLSVGDEQVASDSWRVSAQPVALRIRSGDQSRLIAVDPVPDSTPVVAIRLPARDTVLAIPDGVFSLGADARDDLGLRQAAFEYIVSSGSGESFTFLSGVIGAKQLSGNRSGTIEGQLAIAGLKLKPGDLVHVRAVATDLRDDTASARGASETRTIRIARAGEFDSVSVEAAAPPEEDKAVLSQRMLINLTEALVRRKARLARTTFGDESRSIGRDQARLRKQVGDLVFSRLGDDPSGEHFHGDGHQHEGQELRPALTPEELLKAAENATVAAAGKMLDFEGDETPVVAVNRPLLEAYNFMWDASRELNQGAPERALPPMYRALAAIQRARAAERLYLRSRPPRAVVDVDRARLQGKDKGTPAARESRALATGVARVALARFARLVNLSRTDPAAAADSLLMLRIDLLGSLSPDGAAAAANAANALRNGRDASALLASFRGALGAGAVASDSLSRWSSSR